MNRVIGSHGEISMSHTDVERHFQSAIVYIEIHFIINSFVARPSTQPKIEQWIRSVLVLIHWNHKCVAQISEKKEH